MERRNGGDPLAPPRPPKLLPGLHRPRAPEPPMMSAPLQQQQIQQQHQQQLQQLQQQQRITTQVTTAQSQSHQLLQPPTTAPLQPITFSRRRPPLTVVSPSPIPSLSSSIFNLDLESPLSPVTLALPRPDNERLANEYVDTPFRLPHPASRTHSEFTTTPLSTTSAVQPSSTAANSPKPFVPHNSLLASSSSTTTATTTTTAATTTIPTSTAGTTTTTRQIRPTVLPLSAVTKQPNSIFSKDLPSSMLHDDIDLHPSNGDPYNSITCPECQRCRCEECQRPRQLPSRWVCDNTCLCSAETVIDYVSCLCCVKALYYHCSKDHEMDREGDSISCADDPCSCVPYNRTTRWGCLGALSILLPCLWCYWPMRGCIAVCANCYARHSRHGCRCPDNKLQHQQQTSQQTSQQQQHHHQQQHQQLHHQHNNHQHQQIGRTNNLRSTNNELTPEKRLLDSSPEF